jgi:ribonuclease III
MSSSQKQKKSYQRFEFLGDRVLNLIISGYLYKKFPEYSEGLLTERLKFTSNDNLEEIIESLPHEFRNVLIKFKSDFKSDVLSLNADDIEAYAGNFFLEQGIEKTTEYFEKIFGEHIDDFNPDTDFISKLQVRTQKNLKIVPDYQQVSDEVDKNNVHNFHIQVFIGKDLLGEGFGRSKPKAKQDAAKKALKKLGLEN